MRIHWREYIKAKQSIMDRENVELDSLAFLLDPFQHCWRIPYLALCIQISLHLSLSLSHTHRCIYTYTCIYSVCICLHIYICICVCMWTLIPFIYYSLLVQSCCLLILLIPTKPIYFLFLIWLLVLLSPASVSAFQTETEVCCLDDLKRR